MDIREALLRIQSHIDKMDREPESITDWYELAVGQGKSGEYGDWFAHVQGVTFLSPTDRYNLAPAYSSGPHETVELAIIGLAENLP